MGSSDDSDDVRIVDPPPRPVVIDIGDSSDREADAQPAARPARPHAPSYQPVAGPSRLRPTATSDEDLPDELEATQRTSTTAAKRSKRPASPSDSSDTEPDPGPKRKAKKPKSNEDKVQAALDRKAASEAKKAATKADKASAAAIKKAHVAANKLRTDRKVTAPEVTLDVSCELVQSEPEFDDLLKEMREVFKKNDKGSVTIDTSWRPPADAPRNMMRWRRRATREWDAANSEWRALDKAVSEEEASILLFVRAKTLSKPGAHGEMLDQIAAARAAYTDRYQIFLLAMGVRKIKDEAARATVRLELSRLRVVQRVFVFEPKEEEEAARWLLELTRDISIRPDKMLLRHDVEQLGVSGLKQMGDGPAATYKNQLASFHHVGEGIATSIVELYPSWDAFYRAFADCKDQRAREQLLMGLKCRERKDGVQTNKKVGLGLAKRIYYVTHSSDPTLDVSRFA